MNDRMQVPETMWIYWLLAYYLLCFTITMVIFHVYRTKKGVLTEGVHEEDYATNGIPAPFVRLDSEPGFYETIKTSIMTMFLPLRFGICIFILISVCCVGKIIYWNTTNFDVPTLNKTKRHFMLRLCKFSSKLILLTMGFWITVDRTKESPKELRDSAGVVVGNHISWIDILICNALLGTAFIAKEATTKIPFIGFLSKLQQCCFVSNASRKKNSTPATNKDDKKDNKDDNTEKKSTTTLSTVDKIMMRQKDPMNWNHLLLFPEGTTTNGKYTTVFRSGAFVSGRAVQPVAIHYPFKHFSLAFESIYGAYHIFRTLTQVVNYATITVMPVYEPSEEEQKNPKLYAANCGKTIADHLKIEATTVTFSDKLKYLKYMRGADEHRVKAKDQ